MTAPKKCPDCGANLDAGEVCTCKQEAEEAAQAAAEPKEGGPGKGEALDGERKQSGASEAPAQTGDEGCGASADAGYMEFKMGDSLEHLPATIDFNFQQLKGQLAVSLETYSGLVVTEDGIKAAKEDRAKLNALRIALEDKRKEVKKQCMAPYNDFEAKVKELVGLIDKPIAAIDGQLQQFEDKRRADKRAAVQAIYDETVGELRSLLPFERLWNDAWYNVGVSMKKIREAIVATEEKVSSDLEVLSTVESEFMEQVKMKYLETLDLNAALAERSRLQERAKHLREFEARKAAQAAAAPDPSVANYHPPGQEGAAAVEEPAPAQGAEKVYRLAFECQVTKDQAAALSEYLKTNNISYRRI